MRKERLVRWLTRHRGRWLGGTIVAVAALEIFALGFFGPHERPYEWMMRYLVPPAWIFGLAFLAGIETVRPIHPEPEFERAWTRALRVLLFFPFSILLAIVAVVAVNVGATGLRIDLDAQTGVILFAVLLLGPVTIGMLAAGWFILNRRGTRANRTWFVALFAGGVATVAALTQIHAEWLSGEMGTAGLPFVAAALGIAFYRLWRGPPLPPDETTITIGDATRPTFERARL